MLLDHTHKSWIAFTVAALAASTAVYVFFTVGVEDEPRGGSVLGLTYGILGSGLMVFAALLSARKKVLAWRVGRVQTWMRGHLWLGLLSLPLILFHSGFHFGGTLSTTLMVLLFLVMVSGVAGAAFQHFLPSMMTARVPMETIYEEIHNVRGQLREEADGLVAAVCGPLPGVTPAADAKPGVKAAAAVAEVDEASQTRLREFYLGQMLPFLERPQAGDHPLASEKGAGSHFDQLRILLPAPVHETLAHLEDIAEEERQLNRQVRLHHWLHGWLLVHLPLSWALLVLSAVHAVVALRY